MPSTAIRRYAYRPDICALDVEFVTGRVYRYFAVPEHVAAGFARYRAKGAYFNRALRDRFAFERLAQWDGPDQPSGARNGPLGAAAETAASPPHWIDSARTDRPAPTTEERAMNERDSERGGRQQSGQQEQQSGQQGQQSGGNDGRGQQAGQMNQQSGSQGFGQQGGQQEQQSGGQGYGGQQTGQQEQDDQGGFGQQSGTSQGSMNQGGSGQGGQAGSDFGEESLRSDQASQEEWDSESEDSELGSENGSERTPNNFGSNGE